MILLYPGSFDPVTLGHVDIASRGAQLASRLIVSVLDNPNKNNLFSVQERVQFLRNVFRGYDNIEVDSFSGLLAEYALLKGAKAILRGLRIPDDFEVESRYAAYNRMLSGAAQGGIETVFISASPALSYLSSSIVREAAAHIYAGDLFKTGDLALKTMVPPEVYVALKEKYKCEDSQSEFLHQPISAAAERRHGLK